MEISSKSNLRAAAMRNGVEPVGADQASVAFTAIADNGDGTVRIAAASHGKKKNQCVTIVGGAYAGTYRIIKVTDANHLDITAVFTSTTSGNLLGTGYLDGFGFFVKKTPLTISVFTPEDPSTNSVAVIADQFNVGDEVDIPFSVITVSAGDIEVVRKPIRAKLTYSNR